MHCLFNSWSGQGAFDYVVELHYYVSANRILNLNRMFRR